jgi:hypothetical protein
MVLLPLYGLVARNILSWMYHIFVNFLTIEMLRGIRKCRRVDYLAVMKQVPIIACCWRRKCLPRFSHNRAITSFSHSSTDILFTKIMISLTYLSKQVHLLNLH